MSEDTTPSEAPRDVDAPRPDTSLWTAFRSDRGLAVVTFVLAAFTLAPLFATPFLPLHDLPGNVALAALMDDAARAGTVAAEHYELQKLPLPYTAFYVLVWLCTSAFGVVWGTKTAVGLVIVLLPLGLMKLCLVLERDPRLGLAGFGLAWGHNTIWGFMAYNMGLSLLPFALAALADATSAKEALRRSGWTTLLALTHAQAFGLFGLFGLFLSGRRAPGRRVAIYAASVAPGILLLAPWVVLRLLDGGSRLQPNQKLVEWHSVQYHLDHALGYSTISLPGAWAQWGGQLVFFGALLLPVVAVVRWRVTRRDPHFLPLAIVLALALLLYFATPMAIAWPIIQWYIYPRFAVVVLMMALVLPAGAFRGAWAFALVPALAGTVLYGVETTRRFADFGQRARAFLPVLEAVGPEPRLLPLTLHDADSAVGLDPFNQFHAYVVAEHGGYDPLLYDNANMPMVHREAATLPHPEWHSTRQTNVDRHVRHYDWVLVQGKGRDPLPAQPKPADVRLENVIESGRWRLYRVHVDGR